MPCSRRTCAPGLWATCRCVDRIVFSKCTPNIPPPSTLHPRRHVCAFLPCSASGHPPRRAASTRSAAKAERTASAARRPSAPVKTKTRTKRSASAREGLHRMRMQTRLATNSHTQRCDTPPAHLQQSAAVRCAASGSLSSWLAPSQPDNGTLPDMQPPQQCRVLLQPRATVGIGQSCNVWHVGMIRFRSNRLHSNIDSQNVLHCVCAGLWQVWVHP